MCVPLTTTYCSFALAGTRACSTTSAVPRRRSARSMSPARTARVRPARSSSACCAPRAPHRPLHLAPPRRLPRAHPRGRPRHRADGRRAEARARQRRPRGDGPHVLRGDVRARCARLRRGARRRRRDRDRPRRPARLDQRRRPRASVITPIGLDHHEILGDTLEAIAVEKAGIIKPGVPVVIAEQEPAASGHRVRARAIGAALSRGRRRAPGPDPCRRPGRPRRAFDVRPASARARIALVGRHQLGNRGAARRRRGADRAGADDRDAGRGIAQVRWPGRFERAQRAAAVVGRRAQPAGRACAPRGVARGAGGRRATLVLGVSADKDVDAMLESLDGPWRRVYAVAAESARARTGRGRARLVTRAWPGMSRWNRVERGGRRPRAGSSPMDPCSPAGRCSSSARRWARSAWRSRERCEVRVSPRSRLAVAAAAGAQPLVPRGRDDRGARLHGKGRHPSGARLRRAALRHAAAAQDADAPRRPVQRGRRPPRGRAHRGRGRGHHAHRQRHALARRDGRDQPDRPLRQARGARST